MNHRRIERVAALGRPPFFLVEDIGDLGVIEAIAAKLKRRAPSAPCMC